MMRSTFSTTTIASSTTMPIASTNAKSEIVFSVMPIINKKAKVPIKETGIATAGISVALALPRKMKTTDITRMNVRISVDTTSLSDCCTKSVLSKGTAYATSCGKAADSRSSSEYTPSATASAFSPGA